MIYWMSQVRVYSLVGWYICRRASLWEERQRHIHSMNMDSSEYWGLISKQSRHGLAFRVLPSPEIDRNRVISMFLLCREGKRNRRIYCSLMTACIGEGSQGGHRWGVDTLEECAGKTQARGEHFHGAHGRLIDLGWRGEHRGQMPEAMVRNLDFCLKQGESINLFELENGMS